MLKFLIPLFLIASVQVHALALPMHARSGSAVALNKRCTTPLADITGPNVVFCQPLGAACTSDSACEGGYCALETGTCAAPGGAQECGFGGAAPTQVTTDGIPTPIPPLHFPLNFPVGGPIVLPTGLAV
ncbi:hypothetical protein C8R46DRAFT_1047330 [Mycena filopes]|nr:hypothetical protein C8R46DRAFT_1050718 [Mycena filopes]KAJ7138560.1 hypothetical protein C8R46DRAFT_1047330 [Mycena filopes]